MEISQANINQSTAETKIKLADDIMGLLQVREKNKEMAKDWLIFITQANYRLTAGEIYLAHKMAMTRELLQENGKEFDLMPELSINTTAKILSAYQKHKIENETYQKAKDNLKKSLMPKKLITESEKQQTRNEFLKIVFDDLQNKGFSDDAYLLYNECEIEIKKEYSNFDDYKIKLYNIELAKYKNDIQKKNNLQIAKRKLQELELSNAVVVNKCKSILVSNHLKNIDDFEILKIKFIVK